MNIDAKLEELGDVLERAVATAQRSPQGASTPAAPRAATRLLRRPRVLAGGSLGFAGLGTALVLALTAGGAAAPPAFAVTQKTDNTVIVQFNWKPGSRSLLDVDRVLAAKYHEMINVDEAAGPTTTKGPIICQPGLEPGIGKSDPSTVPPPAAPTIEVQLGADGTGWGNIPTAGNTGTREIAHLTACHAWSTGSWSGPNGVRETSTTAAPPA